MSFYVDRHIVDRHEPSSTKDYIQNPPPKCHLSVIFTYIREY